MCEYCESIKAKEVLSYDNRKSMSVSFGQYKGVKVNSNLYMNGNMLVLSASGSYRSDFDCYYESQGLDIDDEPASRSKSEYIQIKYCPFCGTKLTSTMFEKTKAQDDITALKNKLKEKEYLLEDNSIFLFVCWDNKGTVYDSDGYPNIPFKRNFNEGDVIMYKHREYNNDLTLEEIEKEYQKLICSVYFGTKKLHTNRYGDKPDELTFNTKIRCSCFGNGRFKANCYTISEETYRELVKRKYIKADDKALTELKKNGEKIEAEILSIKKEIKKLERYIKNFEK